MFRRTFICLLSCTLGGCQLSRLAEVGQQPAISQIQNPIAHPNYQPVTMPMPAPLDRPESGKNSLWQTGARSFFKDQRANRVGDVLTVKISIEEKAELSNQTGTNRKSSMGVGVNNFLGYESKLSDHFPKAVEPSRLISMNSNPNHSGGGTVKRKESMITQLAATIIQILPNGNFVISGRQEMRVNYEVREIILTGIVRPSDITSNNTISLDKIAEARFSYGGRGQIDNMQQAPLGHQIVDIISPF